jgi:spore coat protein U-like protein
MKPLRHPGTASGCIRDRQKCKWLQFGKTRGAFRGADPDTLKRLAKKRLIFALFALASAPEAAVAQLACALNVTPVQFDSIAGTSAGTFDARGTITVTCTGSQGASIAACVEVGQSATVAASGQRLISVAKGTGALPVQIFQDPTITRPWGLAATHQAAMLQRTGDGPMSATAYVRAYIQKGNTVPGTYSAQFPVTLRYGAVTGIFADCTALGTVAIAASAAHKTLAAGPAIARKR